MNLRQYQQQLITDIRVRYQMGAAAAAYVLQYGQRQRQRRRSPTTRP